MFFIIPSFCFLVNSVHIFLISECVLLCVCVAWVPLLLYFHAFLSLSFQWRSMLELLSPYVILKGLTLNCSWHKHYTIKIVYVCTVTVRQNSLQLSCRLLISVYACSIILYACRIYLDFNVNSQSKSWCKTSLVCLFPSNNLIRQSSCVIGQTLHHLIFHAYDEPN